MAGKPHFLPQESPLKCNWVVYFLRNTYIAHSTDSGSAGSEGIIECQISSNHLLKLVNLAEIFTGNSVYILE